MHPEQPPPAAAAAAEVSQLPREPTGPAWPTQRDSETHITTGWQHRAAQAVKALPFHDHITDFPWPFTALTAAVLTVRSTEAALRTWGSSAGRRAAGICCIPLSYWQAFQ